MVFFMQRHNEINKNQIASTAEAECVVDYLEILMINAKWELSKDKPPLIQWSVSNYYEACDIVEEITNIYSGANLEIYYDSDSNLLCIPNYIVKELYKSLNNQSFVLQVLHDQLGYSGNNRIHQLI